MGLSVAGCCCSFFFPFSLKYTSYIYRLPIPDNYIIHNHNPKIYKKKKKRRYTTTITQLDHHRILSGFLLVMRVYYAEKWKIWWKIKNVKVKKLIFFVCCSILYWCNEIRWTIIKYVSKRLIDGWVENNGLGKIIDFFLKKLGIFLKLYCMEWMSSSFVMENLFLNN